ncbi:MAG: hypothetical protein U0531_01825 [Dehalococcoidia bacterium]
MSARVPMRGGVHRPTTPAASPATGASTASKAVGVVLATAGAWVILVLALMQVGVHVWTFHAGEALAYAIGIVTYMYLFVGLVVGINYLIKQDRV